MFVKYSYDKRILKKLSIKFRICDKHNKTITSIGLRKETTFECRWNGFVVETHIDIYTGKPWHQACSSFRVRVNVEKQKQGWLFCRRERR
jgi:hypothetical protein